jgi:hypothetical protein
MIIIKYNYSKIPTSCGVKTRFRGEVHINGYIGQTKKTIDI